MGIVGTMLVELPEPRPDESVHAGPPLYRARGHVGRGRELEDAREMHGTAGPPTLDGFAGARLDESKEWQCSSRERRVHAQRKASCDQSGLNPSSDRDSCDRRRSPRSARDQVIV